MCINGRKIERKAIYIQTSVRKRIVLKNVKMVRYSKSKDAARNVLFQKLDAWINVFVQVNLRKRKIAPAIYITDKWT